MNVRLSGAKIRFTQSRLERSVVTYARDSNKEEKPVFVQANSNSGQGHVLHYTTSFESCLACPQVISDWLGKLKPNKLSTGCQNEFEGGGS